MKQTIVYAFQYNPSIHEGNRFTISLHWTKEGAEAAMNTHKQKELEEFNEMFSEENEFNLKFGEHEEWIVVPREIIN